MEQVLIERKLRDGKIQQLNVFPIPSRLSKTFLNKVIAWSSSRYESWKKKEVVDHIFIAMIENGFKQKRYNNENQIEEVTITNDYFHSGSYCECSNMTRKGTYYLDYSKRILLDIDDKDSGEITKVYSAYNFNRLPK